MNKEKLIIQIIKLLKEGNDGPDGQGLTYAEINKKLINKKIIRDNNDEWYKIKELLLMMEKEELIEERSFDDGRIDYSLENKGLRKLRI